MRTGWYISGAGHFFLILLLLFGGLFVPDRLSEVTVSEVSVMSEAEFAALTRPSEAPDIATDAPSTTAPAEDSEPEVPSAETAPEVAEPEAVEEPAAPEASPDVDIPEPIPDALVEDEAPVIDTPATDIDGSTVVPDGVAQPAPRVAPTPSIAPPPDAEVAPDVVEDSAPDPTAEPDVVAEPEESAAPEEASDRIVTEAEETRELAPASSMRPRTRPARPPVVAETPEPPVETPAAPVVAEETPPAEESDPTADAIAAAVAEANSNPAPAPSGPPLTGGERDAFRVAVSQCWNVGSLSSEALGTTVVVSVAMQQSGVPDTGSIRMASFSGGSESAARQAFEAARRAIIRCGARGFPLPVEKYDQWRDIELTFNPEGMQFR